MNISRFFRRQEWVPTAAGVCIICLLGFAVWGPTVSSTGWYDDDYQQVYGAALRPMPTLRQAICEGEFGESLGHPTSERVLGLLFGGYVGHWLGPTAAHWLLGVMHIVCALLLLRVLLMLWWRLFDALAAAVLFVVSPWVMQPVFWWAAGAICSIGATILGMLGIISCIQWLNNGRHSMRWLGATMFFTFASNCWYELWLPLPLLFWGIAVYLRQLDGSRWRDVLIACAKKCIPTFIPTLLWITLTVLSFSGRHIWLPPHRFIRVIFSVQLRIVNWFISTPWHHLIDAGMSVAREKGTGLVCLFMLLTGCIAALRWQVLSDENSGREEAHHRSTSRPLVSSLWLAWIWFLSARVILILQGGIDTSTRHNYPAAMGFSLGAVALFTTVRRRLAARSRLALDALACGVVGVCTLASAGVGAQFVKVLRFEHMTVHQLQPVADSMPAGYMLAVWGDPTGHWGEFQYFPASNGVWLESLLHLRSHGCRCLVAQTIHRSGDQIRLDHVDPWPVIDTTVPINQLVLFHWNGDKLERIESDELKNMLPADLKE